MDMGYIEGRAEALCNMWGTDPNTEANWLAAIEHAKSEVSDGIEVI